MRARLFTRVNDATWSQQQVFDTLAPRLSGFAEKPAFQF